MESHFQLDENIIHLNHAAVAPWPILTRDAVIAFANENTNIGSKNYLHWMQTEKHLKQNLAQLINARSIDEIAILKNTSEGLSLIAQGLDFKVGDNIVIPAEEFPSNKVVWQALIAKGVEVRSISIEDLEQPEQALIEALDERTHLLSCSSVQFARGLRLDLNLLGEACKNNDTLFCVDAIQSLGAVPFDTQGCHADFVVADGHKWMCGPEGTALFYCRKASQDKLQLRQYGWHMLKDPFSFAHAGTEETSLFQIADNAQRFECGSPNMLGIAALNASINLLLEIGIEKIHSKIAENIEYLIEKLQAQEDITILSPHSADRYAGIVTFTKVSVDNEELYKHLQKNDVLCAFRGGGIRFSPHFYINKRQLDIALKMVFDFSN